MINNQKIINRVIAQQIPFLLCFFLLFYSVLSLGQVRFIKTYHNEKNHVEYVEKIVELNSNYYIPIQDFASVDSVYPKFSILKIDRKGNIVKRKYFDDWYSDRGDLYEANDSSMWKISSNIDSLGSFYFTISLLNEELDILKKIEVPRTFPKNGIPMDIGSDIKLANGDYIFMLGVSAYGWKPLKAEGQGINFIYLAKDGTIKTNICTNKFSLHVNSFNYAWQLNDTSIVTILYTNECKNDCINIQIYDFSGNLLSTKLLNYPISKKCGNRYYGFHPNIETRYKFVCLDENYSLIYEKNIPDNIHVRQFWDNRDNNDFRILAYYEIYDTINNTFSGFTAMMDTSFTWQRLRLFSDDENDDLWNVNNLAGDDNNFFATKDGGGLFVFYEVITQNYDNNILLVKIDTNYAYTNTMYRKKDEFIIHPNPNSTNRLFLEQDNWENITVYDYTGFKVHYFENSLFNTMDSIDISAFKKGLYYLSIKLPDKVVFNTFIRH